MTVTDFLNVKLRYGVKANGWSDDTQGIQDFFDDVGAKASVVLGAGHRVAVGAWMPYGDYYVTAPMALNRMRGLILRAQPGSRITYDGDADNNGIIQMDGSTNTIEGLSFYGTSKIGIRLWRQNTNTWIPTLCAFRDLHFHGSYRDCIAVDLRGQNQANVPGRGWNWTGTWDIAQAYSANDTVYHAPNYYLALQPSTGVTPGIDPAVWQSLGGALSTGNNEYHSFVGCTFRGYGDIYDADELGAGIRIWGSQSHNHYYDSCDFFGQDNATNRMGIYCQYGSHGFVERCRSWNNYRDYWFRDFHQGWAVRNCASYGSSQFVRIGTSANGASSPGDMSSNYVDHGANLALNDAAGQEPRSSVFGWAGPTRIIGNYIRATTVNPRLMIGGLFGQTFQRGEFRSNMFVGPSDYSDQIVKVTYPGVGPIGYHGGLDMAGDNTVRCSEDGGSNIYYKPSDETWDVGIQQQDILQVQGIATEGAEPTYNCLGYIDFPDGGGATQSATFDYVESDDYEVFLGAPRVSGGTGPSSVIDAEVDDSSVTLAGFDVVLDTAPVGYSVRVAWILWRQA